jgi:acyl carrier protein
VHALEFSSPPDTDTLRRAIREIVRRHAVLRTTFAILDGQLTQLIHQDADISVPVLDLTEAGMAGTASQWLRHPSVRQIKNARFDLSVDYPIRAALCQLGPESVAMLLVVHHIASDLASVEIMLGDLAAVYSAFERGEPSPLPELPRQYAELVAGQQAAIDGDKMDEHIRYWRQQLADLPPPIDLAMGRFRPTVVSTRAASLRFSFTSELVKDVYHIARHEQVTVFTVILAAYCATLASVTGERDLLVTVPSVQREEDETAGLIGCFLTMLVLRVYVDNKISGRDFIQHVWSTVIDGLEHRDVSLDTLVEIAAPQRDTRFRPLAQVGCAVDEVLAGDRDFGSVRAVSRYVERESVTYDLMLSVQTTQHSMDVTLEYCIDVVPKQVVERIAAHLQDVLRLMSENTSGPLTALLTISDPTAGLSSELIGLPGEALYQHVKEMSRGAPEADFDHQVVARIAAVWKEILSVNKVRLRDDFYDLGGRSMAMIRLVMQLGEAFGIDVPVVEFLQAPTLADQARLIGRLMAEQVDS